MAKGSSSETFAIMEYERGISVERTENGLLLLIFGILLSAVPLIGPIGRLVALIGIVLTAGGREPFGKAHSKGVIRGAGIFIVGTAFGLVGSILYFLFVFSVPLHYSLGLWEGDNALTSALVPYLTSILALEAVGAILTSVALVFFIFFLQKPPGRVLSLAAAAAGVAISILVFSILSSDVTTPLISGPCSLLCSYQHGSDMSIAWAFEDQFLVVSLLNLVPAIIYAALYYAVYSHHDLLLSRLRS